MTTQAQFLYASPRFLTQYLVILLATAYYCLAVVQRGHECTIQDLSKLDADHVPPKKPW